MRNEEMIGMRRGERGWAGGREEERERNGK